MLAELTISPDYEKALSYVTELERDDNGKIPYDNFLKWYQQAINSHFKNVLNNHALF